jgi:arylsulfatase A-like enzyme
VGDWHEALCAETIHVPWLMRFPDAQGAAARSQALVQPADLAATLADWFGLECTREPGRFARSLLPLVRDEAVSWRDRACLLSPRGERGIRTRAWFLRTAPEPLAGDAPHARRWLYAKPDDRFEANDVHGRCEPIAEALEGGWAEFAELARSERLDTLVPLEEQLVAEMR